MVLIGGGMGSPRTYPQAVTSNGGRAATVRTRSAAFFDLDKTVIAKSSALAFGRPFYQGGLMNRRAVLKSSYAQFVFHVSGADEDQMRKMRDHLTALCTGWDVAQVREIVAETLHELIDPLIYEEAADLIEEHRAEYQAERRCKSDQLRHAD